MKTKTLWLATSLCMLAAGSAWAGGVTGPAVEVGDSPNSYPASAGATVMIPLNYYQDPGNESTNLNFTISYDELVVDETGLAVSCASGIPGLTSLTCSVNTAANTINGIGIPSFPPGPLQTKAGFGTLTVPIRADAPLGASLLAVDADFFNAAGGNLGVDNSVDGEVVVVGPDYSSNPAPAAGVDMAGQQSTVVSANVEISNVGASGSTLSGECTETADPDGKFALAGDTTFNVVQGSAPAVVNVMCDSSEIGSFSGEMSCEHNGDGTTEASPAVYALSCTINEGPTPAFTAMTTPSPLDLFAVEEGDPSPTGTINITNTGDTGTTLSGSCGISGDTELSITGGGGAYNVMEGGAAHVVTVSCNTAAEGFYTATVSCTHNGNNVSSPQDIPVSCDVGPAGAAAYGSDPAPGSDIPITDDDVLQGSDDPTATLTIRNDADEVDDNDLTLSCGFTGDSAIMASAPTSPLAPMASTQVTFTCDTAEPGQFSGTYSCDYDTDGEEGFDGSASYEVTCGVREAESNVVESPPSGTLLSLALPPGGVGSVQVQFTEVLDEGVDAELESCSLVDGTWFTIVSPDGFPVDIPSGDTVVVTVEGTAPNDSDQASDTLICFYSDSDNLDLPTQVQWPLQIVVQDVAIPTLSEWSRLALALALFAFGFVVLRRRRFG